MVLADMDRVTHRLSFQVRRSKGRTSASISFPPPLCSRSVDCSASFQQRGGRVVLGTVHATCLSAADIQAFGTYASTNVPESAVLAGWLCVMLMGVYLSSDLP
jgi:hypothetical protein